MARACHIRYARDASQAQHDAGWLGGKTSCRARAGLYLRREACLRSCVCSWKAKLPSQHGPSGIGRAVRAGAGMAEESADLVGRFGRENVFELAGLLLDL